MHLRDFGNARLLEHGSDISDLPQTRTAAHHMVKRKHAVRFAATKRGLKLNNGLAVETSHAAQRLHEQPLHAFGHIRSIEEFDRVAVLQLALAARHLGKVRSKLGIPIASLSNIHMGFHDIAPAGEPTHGLGLSERPPAYGCCLGARVRIRGHCRRALGATVANLAHKRVNVAGNLRINLLGQSAHGVKSTKRVAVSHVLDALVGPLVTFALELDGVILAVTRQLLTKHVTPVDLD